MKYWQIAGGDLYALEAMTHGLPTDEITTFDTRGPTERLRGISTPPATCGSHEDLCVTKGTRLITAFWSAHVVLALASISAGGGGIWLLLLAIGLVGVLHQSSNVIRINRHWVLIHKGLAGRTGRYIALHQLSAVWVQQGAVGRMLNIGRVGMQLTTGEVAWGPIIAHPALTKQALAKAVGRRSLAA